MLISAKRDSWNEKKREWKRWNREKRQIDRERKLFSCWCHSWKNPPPPPPSCMTWYVISSLQAAYHNHACKDGEDGGKWAKKNNRQITETKQRAEGRGQGSIERRRQDEEGGEVGRREKWGGEENGIGRKRGSEGMSCTKHGRRACLIDKKKTCLEAHEIALLSRKDNKNRYW